MTSVVVTERFETGFSWGLEGHGLLECRSHALRDDDGGVWLIDPLDGEGLDEAVAELVGGDGHVAGVLVLLDRHRRASEAVASRHGVAVLDPPTEHACPFQLISLVDTRLWREHALWWPERGVVVVPEALGTAAYFRSRAAEPLAVHPVLRVMGPPRALIGATPGAELLLVGHGDNVRGDIDTSIELAVGEARRELPHYALSAPRHVVRWARAMLGIGRASC